MNIDYRALKYLQGVINCGSFSEAAERLCVTQSAVSQKIKALESTLGLPILKRTPPFEATPIGKKLLTHYQKVCLLESNLALQEEPPEESKISIALSRDLLEIWFIPFLTQNHVAHYHLDILAIDQNLTLHAFKNGQASIAISTQNEKIPGCHCELLGTLRYFLAASPHFVKKNFLGKIRPSIKTMITQPILTFDRQDTLNQLYFLRYFKYSQSLIHQHWIPSVQGFKALTIKSFGYALIPSIDIEKELNSGELVQLWPEKIWEMPLYIHTWALEQEQYQTFERILKSELKLAFQNT